MPGADEGSLFFVMVFPIPVKRRASVGAPFGFSVVFVIRIFMHLSDGTDGQAMAQTARRASDRCGAQQ